MQIARSPAPWKVIVQREGRLRIGARLGPAAGGPHPPPAPSLRPGRASAPGRQPTSLPTPGVDGELSRDASHRPHLTEHLQVVLVLVQVQHVDLQQGGGAAAAQEGAAAPRALAVGAPGREARGALGRCPALALHPESARPRAAAASPAPRSVPIGSRASCASPAGPAPAPRPLRRRGTAGPSAGPRLIPTWPRACGRRRNETDSGSGQERDAVPSKVGGLPGTDRRCRARVSVAVGSGH